MLVMMTSSILIFKNSRGRSPAQALHSGPEGEPVSSIAVAGEEPRCGVLWVGVHDLLSEPLSRGVRGHGGEDEASAVQSQDDEDVEDLEPDRGNHRLPTPETGAWSAGAGCGRDNFRGPDMGVLNLVAWDGIEPPTRGFSVVLTTAGQV